MPKTITQLVSDGIRFPGRFVGGRMQQLPTSVEAIKSGSGAVVDIDGKKVAAYRDREGKLILHSAVCTHLHCIVGWNEAEKTFDCPCHGSRYEADGTLKNGPAPRGLDPV